MELREFAERVLFATSLPDKLAAPESAVTDESPGRAIICPDQPGRPETLIFGRRESSPPLSRGGALEDDAERAVLLHFFANHELLATELMALMLLRFPDAHPEFRLGLYETLREEQRHTTWYLQRLRECGLTFGALPVNRYFWDAVAPVATPLEYVSRLSLTFEQANLDYSLHYADVFARSGDELSAKVLRSICRDEIGHVRYGLEWFRRLREPGGTDWEAFEEILIFPLSPSRAKANGYAEFNRQGRFEAGLDADFIRRLELFERSRGRTPGVFWFCPRPEESATSDEPVEEDAATRTVAENLELLMMFACRRDDVLLVRRLPSLEHQERLLRAGFILPELEELAADGQLKPESLLRDRKLAELRPWAWCPPAVRLFAPLEAGLPAGAPGLAEVWNPQIRAIHSKSTHQALLAEFLQEHPWEAADPDVVGRTIHDIGELPGMVEAFRRMGFANVALKSPFAAAARGNRRWEGELERAWAAEVIERQGALVVEPWLDRVWDFSVQYEMGDDGLRHLDFIRLENNPRGQFRAVASGPRLTRALDPDSAKFIHSTVFPLYQGELATFLERSLRVVGFRGAVGVDAFVYRDLAGNLRFKPIVEINPRYTMGRIVHEIRKQVAPGCSVRLEMVKGAGSTEPEGTRFHAGTGRLEAGRIQLTHAARAGDFGAVMRVGRTLEEIDDYGIVKKT